MMMIYIHIVLKKTLQMMDNVCRDSLMRKIMVMCKMMKKVMNRKDTEEKIEKKPLSNKMLKIIYKPYQTKQKHHNNKQIQVIRISIF